MEDLIDNKILIIKSILVEKCGLTPDIYDELDELLDDIKILSDAKSSALVCFTTDWIREKGSN